MRKALALVALLAWPGLGAEVAVDGPAAAGVARLVSLPRTLIAAEAVSDLAFGEPARVDAVIAALKAQPPVVRGRILGQAQRQVAARVEAGAKAFARLALEGDFGKRFDVYDDMLRSLRLQGVFDGQILYPIIGADFLPSRWSPVRGFNWKNHSRIYKNMTKLAKRPSFAAGLARARVRTVPDMFHEKTVERILRQGLPEGPRTLLLKHADGYSADGAIAAEKRGEFSGYGTAGLLKYKDWLAKLLEGVLRAGDHVVVLSRDKQALAYLNSSRDFRRVKTAAAPRLPQGPQTIMHVDGQALYLPDAFLVYRKAR